MVVNLAVEEDVNGASLVTKGLGAPSDVNDRQPAHPEREVTRAPDVSGIGASMGHRADHALERSREHRRAGREDSSDAAH